MGEKEASLIKTTLSDFPGKVAAAVFLRGCNLRCPYCYNGALVTGSDGDDLVSMEDVYRHLEKRRNVLHALTISGGEALLNSRTVPLIKKAKELGYLIKIDTNGTVPDALAKLCSDPELRPDYIAMDIKTSPQKYKLLSFPDESPDGKNAQSVLKASADIIASYPAEQREWRTVMVRPLVAEEDVELMARLLPADARWYFASFAQGGCLDSAYNDIPPYTQEEEDAVIARASSIIAGACRR